MVHDLLIRGGRVYDPLDKSFRKADIAVAGGRVSRIAPSLGGEKASEVIDASGWFGFVAGIFCLWHYSFFGCIYCYRNFRNHLLWQFSWTKHKRMKAT